MTQKIQETVSGVGLVFLLLKIYQLDINRDA